jgi:hypothetical protein
LNESDKVILEKLMWASRATFPCQSLISEHIPNIVALSSRVLSLICLIVLLLYLSVGQRAVSKVFFEFWSWTTIARFEISSQCFDIPANCNIEACVELIYNGYICWYTYRMCTLLIVGWWNLVSIEWSLDNLSCNSTNNNYDKW